MPDDAPEILGWRTAYAEEVPRGATTVANAARKTGWEVRIMFARVPWLNADGEDKTLEEEGVEIGAAIVQMISVQGRRAGAKFHANWHCKLWTKPGREEGTYGFAGARMWPAREGALFSTKAKKAQHPESLGDKTVGGLKNSKTLTNYLKEAPSCSTPSTT